MKIGGYEELQKGPKSFTVIPSDVVVTNTAQIQKKAGNQDLENIR